MFLGEHEIAFQYLINQRASCHTFREVWAKHKQIIVCEVGFNVDKRSKPFRTRNRAQSYLCLAIDYQTS